MGIFNRRYSKLPHGDHRRIKPDNRWADIDTPNSFEMIPQDYSQGYKNPYINTPDTPVFDNASAQNSEQALREFIENNKVPQFRNRWDTKVYKPEWETSIDREKRTSKKYPLKKNNVICDSDKARADVDAGRAASPEFDALVRRLENSEEEYVFRYVEANNPNQLGAFHTDGNRLIIAYTDTDPNFGQGPLSALFHETEHARQFEDGEIGFGFNAELNVWNPDATYDIVDEAKAWRFWCLSK